MLKAGITGGIGSGKSTIAAAFAALGVPVYNSDREARRLMQTNRVIISGLKSILGDDIYSPLGELRRKEMAGKVFADKQLLNKVNRIVHPVVFNDFEQWAAKQKKLGADWVLCEAAVLIESGMAECVNRIIVVSLPLDVRIRRTMQRDNMSYSDVYKRVSSQLDEEQLLKRADFIVSPDDKHFIMPQLLDICRRMGQKI